MPICPFLARRSMVNKSFFSDLTLNHDIAQSWRRRLCRWETATPLKGQHFHFTASYLSVL